MVQITIRDAGLFGYTVRRLTAIKDKPIYLLTVRIQVAIIVYKVVYGWLVGPGLVGPGCLVVVWLVVVVVFHCLHLSRLIYCKGLTAR